MPPVLQKAAVALLFLLALLFFLDRGPYRALHDSRTGDFGTVYAASRCWLHHNNPYARAQLHQELIDSGAPAALIEEQNQHASLYLISAMPLLAVFAWFPWHVANFAWCIFSLACFAASVGILLCDLPLSRIAKWIAASACLFFSPTYVGILNGNPSVFSISLAILSLHYARRQPRLSALLFAITLCVKPQIALCTLLAYFLWKCWSALSLGFGIAVIISLLAIAQATSFGQTWQWWHAFHQNLANESQPGGLVDPRPSSPYAAQLLNAQTLSYLLTQNSQLAELLVVLLAGALLVTYFYFRKKNPAPLTWIDASFFAAVTLAVTYHRYYDAQLLLALIPAIVLLWRNHQIKTASILALCFALLTFPIQSVFARIVSQPSPAQLLLLRLQPLAVLLAAFTLCLATPRPRNA